MEETSPRTIQKQTWLIFSVSFVSCFSHETWHRHFPISLKTLQRQKTTKHLVVSHLWKKVKILTWSVPTLTSVSSSSYHPRPHTVLQAQPPPADTLTSQTVLGSLPFTGSFLCLIHYSRYLHCLLSDLLQVFVPISPTLALPPLALPHLSPLNFYTF